jgi:NADH-quinone oxidoreductase subunit M
VANHHVETLTDITLREKMIFATLALFVLGMGVYPLPFGEILHVSVNDLLLHVTHSKL